MKYSGMKVKQQSINKFINQVFSHWSGACNVTMYLLTDLCLFACRSVQHVFTIWVKWHDGCLIRSRNSLQAPGLTHVFLVESLLLFFLVFCVMFIVVFFLCLILALQMSLDCPFLMAPSLFSNVYLSSTNNLANMLTNWHVTNIRPKYLHINLVLIIWSNTYPLLFLVWSISPLKDICHICSTFPVKQICSSCTYFSNMNLIVFKKKTNLAYLWYLPM